MAAGKIGMAALVLCAGGAAAYLLDPERGGERRARVKSDATQFILRARGIDAETAERATDGFAAYDTAREIQEWINDSR